MSRSEPSTNNQPLPLSDLTRVLEEHVRAGFPPDLALDLVLNELVVRAADATRASAAALALIRGDEMVCRAATGLHAPDLGIPLNTRDGLSGACVRSRTPQISRDAESDPRVDPSISRRLGVRSMLIVPVFEGETQPEKAAARAEISNDSGHQDSSALAAQPALAGVLEVWSPLQNAFDERAQSLLEEFARDCARIRVAATHLPESPPAFEFIAQNSDIVPLDVPPSAPPPEHLRIRPPRIRQPHETWAVVLASILILAALGVSFLIGSRIGWLGSPSPTSDATPAADSASPGAATATPRKTGSLRPKPAAKTPNPPPAKPDELVIYEKGKVVFRMSPAPAKPEAAPAKTGNLDRHDAAAPPPANSSDQAAATNQNRSAPPARSTVASPTAPASPNQAASPIVPASSTTRIPASRAIWLAPAQAENRLLTRIEPQYPPDALAAHRSGSVTLEVHVAEDGSISSVRTLNGDPLLASAAAQAVRKWRYQPYRLHDRPSPFQTDITLTFSLPD